ncbi:hypothetical protein SGRIM128S_03102 [Streptomyces griseomycini]
MPRSRAAARIAYPFGGTGSDTRDGWFAPDGRGKHHPRVSPPRAPAPGAWASGHPGVLTRCAKATHRSGSPIAWTPRTAANRPRARSSAEPSACRTRVPIAARRGRPSARPRLFVRVMARHPRVRASGSANHRAMSRRGSVAGSGIARETRPSAHTVSAAIRTRRTPAATPSAPPSGTARPAPTSRSARPRTASAAARGRPYRRYPRLPAGPYRPDDRPLHLVPAARVHDGRPAGVREQQPALARHRDESGRPPAAGRRTGTPPRTASARAHRRRRAVRRPPRARRPGTSAGTRGRRRPRPPGGKEARSMPYFYVKGLRRRHIAIIRIRRGGGRRPESWNPSKFHGTVSACRSAAPAGQV